MKERFASRWKTLAITVIAALTITGIPFSAFAESSGTSFPILIDDAYKLALAKITTDQGTVAAQTIVDQKNQFDSNIKALEQAGNKTTASQKNQDKRIFMTGVILNAFGSTIVGKVIQAVNSAFADAQTRVVNAQAVGLNVVQSNQLLVIAQNQLTQAHTLSNTNQVGALVQAFMAGNSINIIQILTGTAGTTKPTPNPSPQTTASPVPQPSGLWSTIEAPRAWDYNPTYPQQSGKIGITYDIGPNQPYIKLSQVPWLKLMPGDTVRIHWQPQPYNEIILLSNRGTASDYIKITGVPGPNGKLPILDGNGAVSSPSLPFLNPVLEGFGMIVISPPKGHAWGYKPGYIEISNLEIRNAHKNYAYSKGDGTTVNWDSFACGIYIERAENIAIRNNEIHDNGLGIFQNSKFDEAAQSRYLLIDRNYLHDNGVAGDAHQHNAYTEGVGTVFQYNYMGSLSAGALGDNIKDRSVGITIRYNYIEGGVYNVGLQDPQSNANYEKIQKDAWGNLLVNAAYMYGNTFVMRDGANGWKDPWDKMLISFGDGVNSWGNIRTGKLYFYNNTVISQYDYNFYGNRDVSLFDINNNIGNPVVYARNNIFYAASATPGAKAAPFSIFYNYGNANFANNWISPGWVAYDQKPHSPGNVLNVTPSWDGSGMGSIISNPQNDPGFVNAAHGDYHLLATSPLVNAGTNTFDSEIVKTGQIPVYEFFNAYTFNQRNQDGKIDVGAFEK